jgi:hypothetical protein
MVLVSPVLVEYTISALGIYLSPFLSMTIISDISAGIGFGTGNALSSWLELFSMWDRKSGVPLPPLTIIDHIIIQCRLQAFSSPCKP